MVQNPVALFYCCHIGRRSGKVIGPMGNRTPLYQEHLAAGGKLVDFAGWDMPIHYGSQIEEHHTVRNGAGMFDVSHMTVVDLSGERVRDYLRRLLANDVARLKDGGKALYSCMLNATGGVIDDLIVYYLRDDYYRMVVNAATREKDLAWLAQQAAAFAVTVKERPELAMIAIQGPNARDKVLGVLDARRRPSRRRSNPSSAPSRASGLSRAPATRARTALKLSCPVTRQPGSGGNCAPPVSVLPVSAHAIRCGSKPA